MVRIYNYRSTINIGYWKDQFKKAKIKFTSSDKKLLKNVKSERDDNIAINNIYELAKKNGLCVPKLTGLEGDCLFESIEINCQEQKFHSICENKDKLRYELAMIFYLFGDHSIIPNNDMTLRDIFETINDIEYVYCHENELLYKYTYHTMCIDMFSQGSWSRLPTELLLRVMSCIYNIKFYIYHNTGDISSIDNTDNTDNENSKQKNRKKYYICLGLIDEDHYIPLIPNSKIDKNNKYVVPKYSIESEKFHKWAKNIADKAGLYTDIDTDIDIESDIDADSDTDSDTDADRVSDIDTKTREDTVTKSKIENNNTKTSKDDEKVVYIEKRKKKMTNKHITTKTNNKLEPEELIYFNM